MTPGKITFSFLSFLSIIIGEGCKSRLEKDHVAKFNEVSGSIRSGEKNWTLTLRENLETSQIHL